MNIIEALNWRYATKRMTGEKLEQDIIDQIIEAIRLAPSSAGLQPIHIYVISDPKVKSEIQPLALGQPQIVESSHLMMFTSWDKISNESIERVHRKMNDLRNLPEEATIQTELNLKNLFSTFSEEEQYHHTAKQAHIAIGVAILAAAQLGIDATPMEGFDKQGIDEYFKLKEKGLRSVLLLALGKRKTDEDWLFPLKKYRQTKSELITEI